MPLHENYNFASGFSMGDRRWASVAESWKELMNGRVHANRIESFWSGQNGEKPSGHLAIGPVCLANLALQLQVCQSCPLNIDIISTLACIFFLLFSLLSFGTLENHWGLCIPSCCCCLPALFLLLPVFRLRALPVAWAWLWSYPMLLEVCSR